MEKEIFREALKRVWKHPDFPAIRVVERDEELILKNSQDEICVFFYFESGNLIDITFFE